MLGAGYPLRRVGPQGPAHGTALPPPPDFDLGPPGAPGPAAPDPHSGRCTIGWIALAALCLALGLLAVAEIDWLHDLPSQPARRVAVVLLPADASGTAAGMEAGPTRHRGQLPSGGAGVSAGREPDWAATALKLARDPAVLRATAAKAGDITPDWLASHLSVKGTCVQTADPGKPAVKGLLVYASVHGQAESRLPTIAAAWAGAFIGRAEASLGAVRARRQEALLIPVRACDQP